MEADVLMKELFLVFAGISSRWISRENMDYTKGELGALHYLYLHSDGIYPGELREMVHVGSGRMADILKSLEGKGMVVRQTDKRDARRILVFITEKGKEILMDRILKVQEELRGLIDYLGERDTEELIHLLKKVEEYRKRNS